MNDLYGQNIKMRDSEDGSQKSRQPLSVQDHLRSMNTQKAGEMVMGLSDIDKQMWALVTKLPVIGSPWQYLIFLINLLLPGIGTMIASCFGTPCSKTQFVIGIAQLFTSYILVGWIWSIYWGCLIVSKSWEAKEAESQKMQQPQ